MQHVHYDLDEVEAGIRRMYAEAPADGIHDDPAVVAAFRRSVDAEVALARWYLSEVMAGNGPVETIEALECIFTNLISNRMRGFDSDPGEPPVLVHFMPRLVSACFNALNLELERGGVSGNGFPIRPVVSGQA